ncbi:MAG: hypothetical protein RJA25_983 [Bacteroidota bacterium]|jgi:hypothetical protein
MPKKRKQRYLTSAMQTNKSANSSYLYWLLGIASGLFLAVVYTLLRNQTNLALSNQNVAPSDFPILTHFFPAPIDNKIKWQDSLKFSIDASVSNIDQALIVDYIKQQKKLLFSTSLTSANKLALSKTTIHWVPYSAAHHPKDAIIGGFVSVPRQINVVMQKKLTTEELRSILLNEIHHITVAEINLYRVNNKLVKSLLVEKGFIMYPFLNEQGKMDEELKLELSKSVDEFFRYVENFKKLFSKNQRNPSEEREFNKYLQTIKNYHPKIYRLLSPDSKADFVIMDFSPMEKNSPLKKMKSILYSHHRTAIKHAKSGKIELLLSANRDDSLLERARAFLYDMTHSYNKINTLYRDTMKRAGVGDKQIDSNFLQEISSEIDERLTIPMKQLFAKRFKDYFNHYARSYLADQDNSHIHSPPIYGARI